jgi:hypothetical protein
MTLDVVEQSPMALVSETTLVDVVDVSVLKKVSLIVGCYVDLAMATADGVDRMMAT